MGIIRYIYNAFRDFIYKLRPSTRKGHYSERLVDDAIRRLSDEYVAFNDLLFKSNDRSTQIDHVIVSAYGVFVIETKGYRGWITGGENSAYWTQTIYRSKHRFYNPIRQNDGHVRFLRHLLKCSVDIPFISIVVFNNSAELKVHVGNSIVINRCDLIWTISQFTTPVIDKATVDWIAETIQQNQVVVNYEEVRQHQLNVKSQQDKKRNLINQGICPRCGGQLVLRQGKYGSFYGCTNYPTCRFTLNYG
jgi:hypothetical protein